MNQTIYTNADFTLPKGLPQSAAKDLAETFGLQADVIDQDSTVRPVPGQPGTWRVGIRSDRSAQVVGKHPGQIRVGPDFYVK